MKRSLLALAVATLVLSQVPACTDVMVKTDNNQVVSARNMDFRDDIKSSLVIVPQGREFKSQVAAGQQGVNWVSKYGYVGITALGMPYVCDGLNEEGLSVALLWLVGTKYPEASADRPNLALEYFSDWVLGNFSSVRQVQDAIQQVNLEMSNKLLEAIPLHIALHDAEGASAVIEFIDGKVLFYQNPNGVLTNDPSFDWQRKNLEYYKKKLEAADPAVSVPEGFFSAERFVRTTVVRDALPAAGDPMIAAAHALQILGLVAPPYGMPGTNSSKVFAGLGVKYDYTQWSVIRDHGNKVLYYRSASNPGLKAVDLKALDLSGKTQYPSLSFESGAWFSEAPLAQH